MKRTSLWTTVAGIVLVLAVFGGILLLVDASAVVAAIGRADPFLLVVVAGTILLWNVSWGIALWHVLRALDIEVPFYLAILVHAAGSFANHVTPFGQAGGEPVTAWLLSRQVDVEYEVSLASITSLDAINVVPSLTFATCGALYLTVVGTGDETLDFVTTVILAVAVLLPMVVFTGWRYRRKLGRVVGSVTAPVAHRIVTVVPLLSVSQLGALRERVAGFTEAIERIAVNGRRLRLVLAFSALGWAFQSIGLWVTFLALGSFVPVAVPFFVLPLGKVGSVLPTPGGLGGSEAINVTMLILLTDVGAATITAAVAIHSVGGYLLTTGVGAIATSMLASHS